MAYIKVALSHESPIMFVPIEQDGKISKETFKSIFPRSHGMFFQHKNNQYVITLINGRFHPPPDGWRNTVFYPLLGEDDYYYDDDNYDDDDYDDDDYEDDGYYQDDGYEDDSKNNVGVKPPQKEDINELYYNLLRNTDDDDFDDDDE